MGYRKVQRFRRDLIARGVLYRDFEDVEKLIDLVKAHLFSLIVEEWKTDKWAQVDAPIETPSLKEGAPRVVVDKRSSNGAKPRDRASKSTRSTTLDEEDLEEPDEEDFGLLDHAEKFHSAAAAMVKTFSDMSTHITLISDKMAKRTAEVDDVMKSGAQSRTANANTQQHDVSLFKKIVDGAARDLADFVGELAQDVNTYRSDNRVMLAELRAMLAKKRELVSDGNDEQELASLRELIDTMNTVKGQVAGFQKAMQETPALTKRFRSARRQGVSMLGELIAEMSFSIDETLAITGERQV